MAIHRLLCAGGPSLDIQACAGCAEGRAVCGRRAGDRAGGNFCLRLGRRVVRHMRAVPRRRQLLAMATPQRLVHRALS